MLLVATPTAKMACVVSVERGNCCVSVNFGLCRACAIGTGEKE